jgi:hypothetical protein
VLDLGCRTIRRVAAVNSHVGKTLHSIYLPRAGVIPGTAILKSGLPAGAAIKSLYLRDGDSVGEHRPPHFVAFGTQIVDSRFGPAHRMARFTCE